MRDFICPHCNKGFKVDETGYADILKQVRVSEFEQQLNNRLKLAEKDKQAAVALTNLNRGKPAMETKFLKLKRG